MVPNPLVSEDTLIRRTTESCHVVERFYVNFRFSCLFREFTRLPAITDNLFPPADLGFR